MRTDRLDGRGLAAAVGSYVLWGLFPAFWALFSAATPIEVLAHRVVWTAVLMAGVLSVTRGWPTLRALSARGWAVTSCAGVLIAVNWGLFIYAVFAGHVVEAALGYFMTPLVSVLLGVVVLHERLRAAQWVAVVLGAAAVVVIGVENGAPPWIAIALAASFGCYGLIKATIPLEPVPGLTAESLALLPLALAAIVWLEVTGTATFTALGPGHLLLMVLAGPATAGPLLLYAVAARRVPLTVIGVLLYLNPTLQFVWGVAVEGEAMPPVRWVGYGIIWVALAVFSADLVRHSRRREPAPVV